MWPRYRLLAAIAALVALAMLVDSCGRTAPGVPGGTSPIGNPTTPPPPVNCPLMPNAALLAGDITVGSTFYGAVAPSGNCATCAASPTANYYPDSMNPVPTASDQKAIGGITCPNLCVCSFNNNCYTRTSPNVNAVLYPYCTGGQCFVYLVVAAQDDTQGFTNGAQTITAASQINPTTLDPYPVTMDDLYPKITYASCNGCPPANQPTECDP